MSFGLFDSETGERNEINLEFDLETGEENFIKDQLGIENYIKYPKTKFNVPSIYLKRSIHEKPKKKMAKCCLSTRETSCTLSSKKRVLQLKEVGIHLIK